MPRYDPKRSPVATPKIPLRPNLKSGSIGLSTLRFNHQKSKRIRLGQPDACWAIAVGREILGHYPVREPDMGETRLTASKSLDEIDTL